MDKKVIRIVLLVAVVAILSVLLIDQLSNRAGKRPDNPFAYDLEGFDETDPGLLTHKEVMQIAIGHEQPVGFAYGYGRIFLITGEYLQVISPEGSAILKKELDESPTAITIGNKKQLLLAFDNHLVMYDLTGEELFRSMPLDEKAAIISVAFAEELIFAADAGNKVVRVFNHRLEELDSFRGTSNVSETHGFILPGGRFTLAVNGDDELWVVNPGLHSMQLYSHSGRLRRYWGEASFNPEGFSGCCNPTHFMILPNGDFVTSEKGLVRVKVHHPSGTLKGVVAGPESFPNGKDAPAVAADHEGNILLLDFEQKLIRIFEERKENN